MNKSMTARLCAAALLFAGGGAFAADTPHAKPLVRETLPPLYTAAADAQAACPNDKVVWVNWSAGMSHLPDDRWYGHTVTGAYPCAAESAQAGIKPAE